MSSKLSKVSRNRQYYRPGVFTGLHWSQKKMAQGVPVHSPRVTGNGTPRRLLSDPVCLKQRPPLRMLNQDKPTGQKRRFATSAQEEQRSADQGESKEGDVQVEQISGEKQKSSERKPARRRSSREEVSPQRAFTPFMPFSTLMPSLFRPFEDLFDTNDTFLSPYEPSLPSVAAMTPRADVYESDSHFHLELELPGMQKNQINLRVEDDQLIISGERKLERKQEDKEHRYRRIERSYGNFQRTFTLPEGVDANAIEAHFDHGVLKVSVPKPKEEAKTGKKIEIQ